MKNFAYHVNAYCHNHETTLRTNDVRIAIEEFFSNVEEDIQCDLLDGFTGEVLAIANNPDHDNYTTAEMVLMMLGFLMEQTWGEDTAPEIDPAVALASTLFGISANEVVTLHNGEGLPS